MKKTIGLLAIIVALWLPRSQALDRFVTPDEPKWLMRSANFYLALAQGDLGSTYQKEHPGVTAMWAGLAGFLRGYPQYIKLGPGQMDRPPQLERYLENHGVEALALLATSRRFIVIAIVIALSLAYLSAVRLVGFLPALVGFLLLAFDPFLIALSSLLHLDGLVSALMLLSMLAWLNYLYNGRRFADLLLSAVSAGLSWLTKSPALFLLPFLGLICLIEVGRLWLGRAQITRAELWKLLRSSLLWAAIAVVVFIILWPAMWVYPIGTVRQIFSAAASYASDGHESAIFFNHAIYPAGIDDWRFYPVSYFWRVTPITLAGLVALIISLLLPQRFPLSRQQRLTTLYLGLFVLLFTVFMSVGAKKFDRYLLPVFAPLDLLAGLGWTAVISPLLKPSSSKEARSLQSAIWLSIIGIGGLAGLVAIQALSAAQTFPYYFTYYNPLAGGSVKAPQVMMIGWGEGLDQAARYLNDKPGADNLKVVSWYADGPFSFLFHGETNRRDLPALPQDLPPADYLVIYAHQWQRQLPSREFLDYYASQQPEKVVKIDGLEYARIYRLR